jgi:predicted membrane-bound spermidine synthase
MASAALHAVPPSAELESLTTQFNTVVVRRVGERIDMDVEGATFATWHPRHLLTGFSWDALAAAALLRGDGAPKSVLVLGLGGGTVTRQLRAMLPEARITGVEIDAGIIDLARRYMDLDAQRLDVHIEDAYGFLENTREKFDAILDDLFLTGPTDVVRSRTVAGGTMSLLKAKLQKGGVLVANLITDAGEHKTVRTESRRAYVETFASVRAVLPPRGLNEILVGGERTRPQSALSGYASCFAEPHDQRRLSEIVVKSLRRR